MSDGSDRVTQMKLEVNDDYSADCSEESSVRTQRLFHETQSTDSNQSTLVIQELGNDNISNLTRAVPVRGNNKAAERSRLYRERHRDEVNRRRRDVRHRQKKLHRDRTAAVEHDTHQMEHTHKTTLAKSNIKRQQRYYERHKEEINKRKRDRRRKLKQNMEATPATAAERNRTYRERNKLAINERRRHSRRSGPGARGAPALCNADDVARASADQPTLIFSNDASVHEIEQNLTGAPPQLQQDMSYDYGAASSDLYNTDSRQSASTSHSEDASAKPSTSQHTPIKEEKIKENSNNSSPLNTDDKETDTSVVLDSCDKFGLSLAKKIKSIKDISEREQLMTALQRVLDNFFSQRGNSATMAATESPQPPVHVAIPVSVLAVIPTTVPGVVPATVRMPIMQQVMLPQLPLLEQSCRRAFRPAGVAHTVSINSIPRLKGIEHRPALIQTYVNKRKLQAKMRKETDIAEKTPQRYTVMEVPVEMPGPVPMEVTVEVPRKRPVDVPLELPRTVPLKGQVEVPWEPHRMVPPEGLVEVPVDVKHPIKFELFSNDVDAACDNIDEPKPVIDILEIKEEKIEQFESSSSSTTSLPPAMTSTASDPAPDIKLTYDPLPIKLEIIDDMNDP